MRGQGELLTPTQVGLYIKAMMERDRMLSNILVQGEISNYKLYPSGHHYFTLKDAEGALKCVMFRGNAATLRFRPQNGMKVIAAGQISVFPRDGQYQMYCSRLTPDGAGDLHVAFEQRKEMLLREGLFDQSHKKPIPDYPKTIALITSPAGAAVRDMLRILGARWPMAQVRILPVRVQGEGAAQEIAAAIRWANWQQVADLIITGRGGGSMEDLWAFNEEVVARAIFDSEIPVISAVGHEPDVTISDFVADLRAATPSNAAELAVPDQNELYALLVGQKARLEQSMFHRLGQQRRRLEQLAKRRPLTDPTFYVQTKRQLLDRQTERLSHAMAAALAAEQTRRTRLEDRLQRAMERTLSVQRNRMAALAAGLDAMSPLKVLGRGYAIAQKRDGTILTRVADACPGDRFDLRLSDGAVRCQVEET